ncbi:MAG: hypothetical protein RRC34_06455 [Lentisphaeria bacterium]|nr:hypothetical protein [Lentisphaeria bacterium]
MKRERIWEFLEAYRDGVIDEAAATDLAYLIRAGGDDADWVLDELAFTGWVQQALEQLDEAGFVRSFLERLKAERGEDDFTRVFSQRLAVETQKIKKQEAAESRLKMPFRDFLGSATDIRSARRGAARRRGTKRGAAAVALVVVCLVIIISGSSYLLWTRSHHRVIAGMLEEFSPGVLVLTGDRRSDVAPGGPVREGQAVHVPSNGHAVFSDSGGGRWRLHGGSKVVVMPQDIQAGHLSFPDAEGIYLQTGKLAGDISASGSGLTFVTTPHATAEFNGPVSFSLSATAGSTFAEVEKGKLVITRKTDGRTIELRSGHYAMVAADADFESLEK